MFVYYEGLRESGQAEARALVGVSGRESVGLGGEGSAPARSPGKAEGNARLLWTTWAGGGVVGTVRAGAQIRDDSCLYEDDRGRHGAATRGRPRSGVASSAAAAPGPVGAARRLPVWPRPSRPGDAAVDCGLGAAAAWRRRRPAARSPRTQPRRAGGVRRAAAWGAEAPGAVVAARRRLPWRPGMWERRRQQRRRRRCGPGGDCWLTGHPGET